MAVASRSARATVLRSALLFTPFLAVASGALVFIVRDVGADGRSAGGIVGIILVGSVTLLLGYQVIQSVRDMFSETVETTGLVERKWSRSDFMVFRNTYIFVGRDVFRLEPKLALDVELGTTVRVVHYPHTSTVESIEIVAPAEEKSGMDSGR